MNDSKHSPLADKVVIVTGASKRLGRCYALSLARAGAQVVAMARSLGDDPPRMGTLTEVAATASQEGLGVAPYRCDLGDEDDIVAVVDDVVRRFGRIDAIVNNAVAPIDQIDPLNVPRDVWDEFMRVNVRAPYVLIARAVPHMKAQGGGSIINITSLSAGKTGKGGGAHLGLLHYGVSKAALNRLTTYFAAELEEDNIAVNAISPGDVSVYMRVVNDVDSEDGAKTYEGNQLDDQFWGNPIVHLAGARPSEVTGEILHTYTFGESWGPRYETPPQWSPEIQSLLGRDNLRARK